MRIPILNGVKPRIFQDRRRRYPRFRLDVPIAVTVLREHGYQTVLGRTNDVAVGGIGAVVTEELPIGEVVKMEFPLETGSDPLSVRGVVRYRKSYLHGIEFLGLSATDLARIQTFCDHAEHSRPEQ